MSGLDCKHLEKSASEFSLPVTSLVVQWQRIRLPMQGTAVPWSGKIPHATGQLSPCATTNEASAPGAHALRQERPLQ